MNITFTDQESPVNAEEVQAVLSRIGVLLPLEYKTFLTQINGGTPERTFLELRKFDAIASNINCYVIVDRFFSLGELEEVWYYTKEDLQELLLFPIAEVRGGMLICIRQSDSDLCEIYFYDANFGVIAITESLREFFDALISKKDVDYKKYGIDFRFDE